VKRALAPERTRAERRFQRRYIRLAVSIRTDDGKKLALGESTDISIGGMRINTPSELAIGDVGTAQITMPSGETVRAAIDIVWADHGADGSSTYGVNFRDLGSSERFALLEAIYSPAGGVFDEDADPEHAFLAGYRAGAALPDDFDARVRVVEIIELVNGLANWIPRGDVGISRRAESRLRSLLLTGR